MRAENIRFIENKKENNSQEKQPSKSGEKGRVEKTQEGAKTIYEAPHKEYEEENNEKASKSRDRNEERKGARYIGKPEAPGHPIFSLQARKATSPERYGVPRGLIANRVRRPRKH